eukprot:15459795-Alexandrium_andersonii.AAC.1
MEEAIRTMNAITLNFDELEIKCIEALDRATKEGGPQPSRSQLMWQALLGELGAHLRAKMSPNTAGQPARSAPSRLPASVGAPPDRGRAREALDAGAGRER